MLEVGPVAINSLVKLVVARLETEASSRQHQFVVELVPDLPPVMTDSKRLYQVMTHLVNNAIKYTPDGGRIRLTTCLDESPSVDSFVQIEVADTGIGIAPEHWEQIFDKFYRTGETSLHSSGRVKFKGAGPGLGLSIAKGIIEALGGEIWAESPGYDEVNCPGSTFYVRLPVNGPTLSQP
jgi:signal transduction histidine kinase